MARARTILDSFVGDPRPGQADGLLQIADALGGNADVVVVSAPTGAGKLKVGECILRHATSKRGLGLDTGLLAVPTNILVDQALEATRGFETIRRQDMYQCNETPEWSCAERKAEIGACCKSPNGNAYSNGACPYLRDLRLCRTAPKVVATYHSALVHKLVDRDIVVLDEGHNAVPLLRSLSEVVLWRHDYGWRGRMEEPEDVVRWLSDDLPTSDHDERTDQLWRALTSPRPTHMLDLSPREWRGQVRDCIAMVPLDVRSKVGLFLRSPRIVLMSATIGPLDIAALGLDRRRVTYVDIPSPIPPAQRPIEYVPVADMRFAGRTAATQEMARWIVEEYLPAWVGHRGLIHATYAVAEALMAAVGGNSRLVFHDRGNKQAVLSDFLQVRPGDERVLVGSGMEEGLDLAGALARFQLITAVPRASVADPAVAWMAEHHPAQYEWDTIRKLVQASGRVARGPEDWGVTTIADASAGSRELRSAQLPLAFRQGLAAGGFR
jgi:hypothetical protein